MADEFPLREHLDKLVEDLHQLVPDALEQFDEESIHKARVTTRRLKAAVELLDSVLDSDHAKPFAKVGRKLRRRLGPMRDMDVMIGHLDDIPQASKFAPAVDYLKQQLQIKREKARSESTQKMSPIKVVGRLASWSALRRDVTEAGDRTESLIEQSVHRQVREFQAQSQGLGHGTDPHALRIAGKSLRYTLELAKASGHQLPSDVLKTFKRMQDMLGTWHDFVVLASRAMKVSVKNDLPLHDPALQRQVLELTDYCMRRAQRQLDLFQQTWAKKGPDLTQAIESVFAKMPVPIEQKKDPDPSGSDELPAAEPPVQPLPDVSTTPPTAA
ncbi:MAG TPA: CHAD domain-containing protein [Tepidisphaeraceae bacterium]|nr:CHAD domain-containing protein [Tepidisphaeraceae bacterium]